MARLTITIDSEAIQEALVAYIANQGLDITNKEVKVQMTAGRGANGYSAAITIISNTVSTNTSTDDEILTREVEYSKDSIEGKEEVEVYEEGEEEEEEEETDIEDPVTTSLFT